MSRSGAQPHLHERGHITDSRFHGHMYATDASRQIFCDVCRLQRWLDIEAALALSQADLGMIPDEAAVKIGVAARIEHLDLETIQAEIRRTHHSLVPLIRALQSACGDSAGEFVHYGATTQDIQDTGQSLEMRDVLDELDRIVSKIVRTVVGLAREYGDVVIIGRTHGQPALPTTFGLKLAGWVDELLRDLERIEAMRPRVLAVQLFGGVGTMSAWGDQGPPLVERLAERLDLRVPMTAWHASRDRIAEYASSLAMLVGTLARIADEVRTLSRPEFGELELGWHEGQVGSSTMPHKRNPEAAQQVVALARLAAGQVPGALHAMIVEHERDSRTLRMEWPLVADVSHYALAAARITDEVLSELAVRPDAMEQNALRTADLLATESLMLALADKLGKQSAYDLVYGICQAATSAGRRVRDELANAQPVRDHLTAQELDEIFDPARHVGAAHSLAERILDQAEERLGARERAPVAG
jgi:adenylosuccinate lyase